MLTQPVSTNSSFLGIEICYLQKRWKACYFKIYSASCLNENVQIRDRQYQYFLTIVKFLLDELSNRQYYGTLREMFSTRFFKLFQIKSILFEKLFQATFTKNVFLITISEPISY